MARGHSRWSVCAASGRIEGGGPVGNRHGWVWDQPYSSCQPMIFKPCETSLLYASTASRTSPGAHFRRAASSAIDVVPSRCSSAASRTSSPWCGSLVRSSRRRSRGPTARAAARRRRVSEREFVVLAASLDDVLGGIARTHGSAPTKKVALLRDPLLEVTLRSGLSTQAARDGYLPAQIADVTRHQDRRSSTATSKPAMAPSTSRACCRSRSQDEPS